MRTLKLAAALGALAVMLVSGCATKPGAADVAATAKLEKVIVAFAPEGLKPFRDERPAETEEAVTALTSHLETKLTEGTREALTGDRPVNVIASISAIDSVDSTFMRRMDGTVSLVDIGTDETLTETEISAYTPAPASAGPGILGAVIVAAVTTAIDLAVRDGHEDVSERFADETVNWLEREPSKEQIEAAEAKAAAAASTTTSE